MFRYVIARKNVLRLALCAGYTKLMSPFGLFPLYSCLGGESSFRSYPWSLLQRMNMFESSENKITLFLPEAGFIGKLGPDYSYATFKSCVAER
jgi:hypothetical protein